MDPPQALSYGLRQWFRAYVVATERIILSAALTALLTTLCVQPARAFDFFGLLGSEELPPAPARDSLSYKVEFAGLDDDAKLKALLQEASNTHRLRQQAPAGGAGLARRVSADFPRLAEALWASGYYDAEVRASVAGVAIAPDGRGEDAAARAAESHRARDIVPVRFEITPGPLFHLRHLVVYDSRTHRPIDPALFRKRAFDIGPEEPARAAALRTLQAEWVDALRARGFALAKVIDTRPVILHKENVVDVAVTIDPGPHVGIGKVELSGSPGVDPAVIRSFIYLEEGEEYSPKKLADTRKSIARIETLGSIKVEDGEKLDANGNLPILVETAERKPNAVGISALFSNVDGPSLRTYWMNRNLFGGAERLRIDLEGGLAPFGSSASFKGFNQIRPNDLVGRAKISFIKPALYGTRNDLLLDAGAVREKTDYYWAEYGGASAAIRHRFSDVASVQAGIELEHGHTFDVFGPHDYSLLGFPLSGTYDSTDSLLAPTKGVRASGTVTPYVKSFRDSVGMVQSKGQVTGYWAADEDARYILAGRVAAGSISGAQIQNIPASHRFFAGGGGSVRGYRYRSLSPTEGFGFPVGGRSLLEASFEARMKVYGDFGIVPFFDTGAAFSKSYPDFNSPMRMSAGLGLRYYTGIGPIRLDVAAPIGRKPGESRYALFIGIGESF